MTDCERESIDRESAADLLVRDVMIPRPKTLPAGASVADVRRFFENPRVDVALLVDGPALAGTIARAELPRDAEDDAPALRYAERGVGTILPDRPVAEALARLDADSTRRLAVVDAEDATLRGLVCLTHDRAGFCSGS